MQRSRSSIAVFYGDSVYETIGTAYGRLFAANGHLVRLERSAQRIGLRVPPGGDGARHRRYRGRRRQPESRVRIMLTRGAGKLDLIRRRPTTPSWW